MRFRGMTLRIINISRYIRHRGRVVDGVMAASSMSVCRPVGMVNITRDSGHGGRGEDVIGSAGMSMGSGSSHVGRVASCTGCKKSLGITRRRSRRRIPMLMRILLLHWRKWIIKLFVGSLDFETRKFAGQNCNHQYQKQTKHYGNRKPDSKACKSHDNNDADHRSNQDVSSQTSSLYSNRFLHGHLSLQGFHQSMISLLIFYHQNRVQSSVAGHLGSKNNQPQQGASYEK